MLNTEYILLIGGVIVFDTLLIWWFFFRRPARAGRFATIEVPGEEIVELPPGTARLTYRVAIDRTQQSLGKLEVPDALQVAVESAEAGDAVQVERIPVRTQFRSLRRRTVQAQFGSLQVPAAGRYTVSASGAPAGSENPAVLVG